MIDRSLAATPGGKFVSDASLNYTMPITPDPKQELLNMGISESDIVQDNTNVFLINQQDVICYFGQHVNINSAADNYTTWGRPYNTWHNGGIAVYNTNDGQSFRTPKYLWWELNRYGNIEAGKLKANMRGSDNSVPEDKYRYHQMVLCDESGNVLKRVTFNRGWAIMDLSDVTWPANHKTSSLFREAHFPEPPNYLVCGLPIRA